MKIKAKKNGEQIEIEPSDAPRAYNPEINTTLGIVLFSDKDGNHWEIETDQLFDLLKDVTSSLKDPLFTEDFS